jgi:hypothetical protein
MGTGHIVLETRYDMHEVLAQQPCSRTIPDLPPVMAQQFPRISA